MKGDATHLGATTTTSGSSSSGSAFRRAACRVESFVSGLKPNSLMAMAFPTAAAGSSAASSAPLDLAAHERKMPRTWEMHGRYIGGQVHARRRCTRAEDAAHPRPRSATRGAPLHLGVRVGIRVRVEDRVSVGVDVWVTFSFAFALALGQGYDGNQDMVRAGMGTRVQIRAIVRLGLGSGSC